MNKDNFDIEKKLLNEVYSLLSQSQGESLKDLIEAKQKKLGLSQRALSLLLGIERKSLQRIMEGEAQKIDVLTFIKINQFLEIGIENLTNSFVNSLSTEQIGEIEKARKSTFIVKHFDLEMLKQIGFIGSTVDFEAIEERIIQFFGLSSIFDYQEEISTYYSKLNRDSSSKSKNFWVKSALEQFKKIDNPNLYDRDSLLEIIPLIKPYSRYEKNGLLTVARALYNIGITVIFQKSIPKLQVRGAIFIHHENPCIVLADIGYYDTVWFTLLHELHHILYDFKRLRDIKYIILGEGDLFLMEEKANEFARDYFLSEAKIKYISNYISSHGVVQEYAKKEKIHESIIYGFYSWQLKQAKDDDSGFKKYNKYRPKALVSLKSLNSFNWSAENIDEMTQFIKRQLSI